MSTIPTYPTGQQLAQSALERVRMLCKGNGVKADTITIASHSIDLHTLHAGTYLELKPVMTERVVPGKSIVGTLVTSREESIKQVDQAMIAAARDPGTKTQITANLLARPDKGFGLSGQTIPLEFLKRDFTYHDACGTCRGSGQSSCLKCGGRKTETCVKCTGRGLMTCPTCRATGLIQGKQCNQCRGQRYVPCNMCQRSGQMRCRTCNGTGIGKCAACSGLGWKSHIVTLNTVAVTYFEYDGKTIPKGAADMIETSGATLVADDKIKIEGRVADDKENVLGASYEATFPYGDMVFVIGKKEYKCGLFGYKADLTDFPNVLDKLVQKGIEDLEEAANDVGSVAAKIKQATRYRVIAQAFLLAAKMNAAKATALLLKKYDIGLSHSIAEKIVLLADRTTARITKKPRVQGMVLGLGISTLVTAGFYLLPIRSVIAAYLPNPALDIILDLLPIALGGVVTTIAIQMRAASSMRVALGHLSKPGQQKDLVPKAGPMAWFGYGGAFVMALVMMEICVQLAKPAPHWYMLLRGLIVPS